MQAEAGGWWLRGDGNWRWRLLAWAVCLALLALGTAWHEPWRDELQVWGVVRHAGDWGAILREAGLESHPPLWYALVWLVAQASWQPQAMQWLHFAVAAGTAALLLSERRFPLWLGLGLCLGYFLVYEYAVVCRNYGLAVLLAIAAVRLAARPRPGWGLALCLALLPLANAMSWLLTPWLCLGLGLFWRERTAAGGPPGPRPALWGAGLAMIGGAMILGYAFIREHPQMRSFQPGYHWGLSLERLHQVLVAMQMAWLPWHPPGEGFWLLHDERWPRLAASLLALALGLLALTRRWWLPCLYLAGATGYGTVFYLKDLSCVYTRHAGFVFLAWLLCLCWQQLLPALAGETRWRRRLALGALLAVLALHLAGAVRPVCTDWRQPFSAARATAAWLRAHHLADAPLLGDNWGAMAVGQELDRPVFFPGVGRTLWFWDFAADYRWLPPGELLDVAQRQLGSGRGPVVLILNYPLEERMALPADTPDFAIRLARREGPAMVVDEGFHVYVAWRPGPR